MEKYEHQARQELTEQNQQMAQLRRAEAEAALEAERARQANPAELKENAETARRLAKWQEEAMTVQDEQKEYWEHLRRKGEGVELINIRAEEQGLANHKLEHILLLKIIRIASARTMGIWRTGRPSTRGFGGKTAHV